MIKNILSFARQLMFDAFIWLSLYMIATHSPAYEQYAKNFLHVLVFCYFTCLLLIITNTKAKETFRNDLRDAYKLKGQYFWRADYSCISTFMEALAITTVGLTYTGVAYLLVGAIMASIYSDIKKELGK